MKKTFYFATSNKGKFSEAKEKFRAAGLSLRQKPVNLLEIQADDLIEISRTSARELSKTFKKPFFVEDAGFFVKALHGFPGPYTKHTYFTIGPRGILKLMQGIKNRSAHFESVITFIDAANRTQHPAHPKVFKGMCRGSVANSVQGKKGFGFDPIFIPEGERKTFASDLSLKQRVSHRSLALTQLINYLKREYS